MLAGHECMEAIHLVRGVVLDVEGTLVDSAEAQARAWLLALREQGIIVSLESIQSRLGLGPRDIVRSLTGTDPQGGMGEALLAARTRVFLERCLSEVRTLPHAHRLVERMAQEGLRLAALGSASAAELDALLA